MKRLTLAVTFFTFISSLSADSLDAVLSRMDDAAAKFHSMSADLSEIVYTAILDDKTTETGKLRMQKAKEGTEAIIEFTGSKDQRTIGFFNKTIQIYFPKLNLVQVYKLGKKAKLLDQFLLLGFGTSGKDLTKGYDVQFGGTEQVNGRNASKL